MNLDLSSHSFSPFNAFYTLLRREVVRFLRIWPQSLLPSVITQSLYFFIFGQFIGSRLGNVGGLPYMAFILPGLVMMAVINNAFQNVAFSFYASKFQRSIEELLISPMSGTSVVGAYALGGVLRGLLVGLLVFAVSVFFLRPQVAHPLVLLIVILLTAMVLSLAGLINGIFAKSFDDVSLFPTFVLIPLTYFGGVFYSIQDLAPVWQTLSKFNPILYMVDAFRYGLFGVSDLSPALSLSVLLVLSAVLIGVTAVLFKKGIGLRT